MSTTTNGKRPQSDKDLVDTKSNDVDVELFDPIESRTRSDSVNNVLRSRIQRKIQKLLGKSPIHPRSQPPIRLNLDHTQQQNTNRARFTTTQYISRMVYIVIEYAALIGLTFISFALFQNSTIKLSRPPNASPFFSPNSLVVDFYNGEVSAAMRYCHEVELSVMIYYAPWDADCQYLRQDIEIVAQYFRNDVRVVAVNCWQPNTECATIQRKKFVGTVWPGIVVHINNEALNYRGPRKASYIIQFINKVKRPYYRITNARDFNEIFALHDVIIFGSVNTSAHFKTLYRTFLRIIEQNPLLEVGLALSTSKITNVNNRLPSLKVYSPVRTITYTETNWTVSDLYNFAIKHAHAPVRWLTPPVFGKSSLLADVIESGPSLIVFTPRNPISVANPYFDSLRAINLIYNNCANQTSRNSVILRSILTNSTSYYKQLKHNLSKCVNEKHSYQLEGALSYCLAQSHSGAFNSCIGTDTNAHAHKISSPVNELLNSDFLRTIKAKSVDQIEQTCGDEDPRSSPNLVKAAQRDLCRTLLYSTEYYKNLLNSAQKLLKIVKVSDIDGLACKYNRTIRMALIDSLEYSQFATNLGIDITNHDDFSAVTLIDAKNENQYVMNGAKTFDNIKNFIVNFTRGELPPAFSSRIEQPLSSLTSCRIPYTNEGSMCIKELKADNFLETVFKKNTAVIVLFHTSYCSFCNDASRALLYVARQLASFRERIQFYRIDGETQVLPTSYNIYTYPTVLFFPAKRKGNSHVYPMTRIRTVPNVLNFVLSNLDPPMRLEVMWTLCDQYKRASEHLTNFRACVSVLRTVNLNYLLVTQRELAKLRVSGYRRVTARYVRQMERFCWHLRDLYKLLSFSSPVKLSVKSLTRVFYALNYAWERL